jgi:dTDP-glucose 4,6-dehydratase
MERVIVTGGAGFIGVNFVRLTSGENSSQNLVVDKLTYAGHRAV